MSLQILLAKVERCVDRDRVEIDCDGVQIEFDHTAG
jgi:hypothetical protein